MGFFNNWKNYIDPLQTRKLIPGYGDDGSSDGGFSTESHLNRVRNLINEFSYKPQHTGATESGLFNLFQDLTGLSGQGVQGIPFDIGLPTTGLYDALTRNIKDEFLGTPGGPESGRVADIRAYYNNLGVPEQAINQERLANRDLNNSLVDTAAKLNETQKDRLLNVLSLGSNVGGNLFGQQLNQHRANAGLAVGSANAAAGIDAQLQEAIRQSNQQGLNDLLSGIGTVASFVPGGQPVAAGATALNLFNKTPVSRSGGFSGIISNPYGPGTISNAGRSSEGIAKLLS